MERKVDNQRPLNVVVSDLTYVRVGNRWHYICVLVDLFNREIIGHSAGPHKDAELVKKAFNTVPTNLNQIKTFHTDCGMRQCQQLKKVYSYFRHEMHFILIESKIS